MGLFDQNRLKLIKMETPIGGLNQNILFDLTHQEVFYTALVAIKVAMKEEIL
jgi:hypothetical protein